MAKIRIVERNKNITIFNPQTGETIIEGDGNCDTPLLLDVSLTNKCSYMCEYCYKKSSPNGKNMSLEDFNILLSRMKDAHVFQVAYGGGNPNEHPNFIDILRMTYEAGIIPNYSTNGSNMTDEIIEATAKYCGSVAISIHKKLDFYKAIIENLTDKINKVNLHLVMTNTNSNAICELLCNPPEWLDKINAVVLLRYKNVRNTIEKEPSKDEYFQIFEAVKKSGFKIAFDACSYPLIKEYLPEVDNKYYDYCQGARSSAYINEDLTMSPCSFDCSLSFRNNLRNFSIREIFFNSKEFLDRKTEIVACKVCKQYF